MGELIDLQEFRKAKEEKEIEELRQELDEIIKNLPEEKYIPIFSEDEFQYFSHQHLEWPINLDGYSIDDTPSEFDFYFKLDWEKD